MAAAKGKTEGASAPSEPTPKDAKSVAIPISWLAVGSVIAGTFWINGIEFLFPKVDTLASKIDPDGNSNVVIVPFPTALAESPDFPFLKVVEGHLPDLMVYPGNDPRNSELWSNYQAEADHQPFAKHFTRKDWRKRLRVPSRKG